MTEPVVRRLIRAFDRETGEFVCQVELLPGVTLRQLQELLGVDSENPMYDAFVISPEQAETIASLRNVDLQRARLDLFVEADAAD